MYPRHLKHAIEHKTPKKALKMAKPQKLLTIAETRKRSITGLKQKNHF